MIMITAEALSGVIAGYLTEKGLFLVDIEISKDNDITIAVESSEGDVKIENCVDIDHIVSGVFDRDVEDYSLTVTSAGLDQPFKVLQQYRKFIGNEVEVVVKGGGKMKGILSSANEEGFEVTVSKMVKVEGSKKKVQQDTVTMFSYDGIKSCKPVIKFK
ncbi:MAG: ribosome assembly cofactor RimP [Bacteroidales bacterium]|nr:ribosome assembly cofactor RimP [Bacteroidales bacterium]